VTLSLIRAVLSAAVIASLVTCGGGGSSGPRVKRLSIATGGTGGVYYPYGGALAKIISDEVPGVEATAEVTAASVDNLKFLRDGRSDIAFTLADTLADAVKGSGAFAATGPVPAQALAVLYTNYTHIVALAATGIGSIADLRGRAVSTCAFWKRQGCSRRTFVGRASRSPHRSTLSRMESSKRSSGVAACRRQRSSTLRTRHG
jgi:TRAP transporter TAXI family solute receptor